MSIIAQTFTHSQQILRENGFVVTPNSMLPEVDLRADIFALKKGRTALVLPFADYLFIHDFDQRTNTLDVLHDLHEKARRYVNAQYKMPKALRLSVPNIATIAISSGGFDELMKAKVQEKTRSIIGGEFHAMFLIDLQIKAMYSQGVSLTYVPGEARLIWGSRKQFKKIDPQNRAYYTVQAMAEAIFQRMT